MDKIRLQLKQIEKCQQILKEKEASDNIGAVIANQINTLKDTILEAVANIVPALVKIVPTEIDYTIVDSTTIHATTGHREYLVQYASNMDLLTVIDVMVQENSSIDDYVDFVLVGYIRGTFDDREDFITWMITDYQEKHDFI